MSRILPLIALLFAANTALAAVPIGLVGEGCDDENPRDGFVDDVNDCPDDFLKCIGVTDEQSCLGDSSCSWDATNGICQGGYWDFISYIPARNLARIKEDVELTMGAGMHADRAWQREVGRFDTVVAVLDSGIRWHERDLQNKHYLNRAELPVPQDGTGATCGRDADVARTACPEADAWDCNNDCVFNVQDYINDPRIPHAEVSNEPDIYCVDTYNFASANPIPNSFLEPSDLLCIFADGTDGVAGEGTVDNNGYVDDISGWDHLWDDPNPGDDTDFGHGTGEARDSTAEGWNGFGLPGVCPNCSTMAVRVGDSFVVDSNNWAAGIIFAVDTGAKVLQSAVGAINNTSFGQAAIEYAWQRGVIDIISAADETAQHQNYPGAIKHAAYVHAVRYDAEDIDRATTYLNFSNCTNFGARLTLSAPSTGCSSGATGASSGMSGLIASAMQNKVDAGLYSHPNSSTGLSGAEILQVLRQAVDDIDLPTSQPDHPEHDPERYPSNEGWDMYTGYGRINARTAVDMILDEQIPPEADILEPEWFDMYDPTLDTIRITGNVAAPRSAVTEWVLEYAVGVEPDDSDASTWVEVSRGTSMKEDAVLGVLDPTTIDLDPEARIERYNTRTESGEAIDDNYTKALKVNRFTVTLRLRVTSADGLSSDDRRAIYVHHDPTWKEGFPMRLGVSGEASPKLFDLDGRGGLEIILADADGYVHALTGDGEELEGWPVWTNPNRVVFHPESAAYTLGADGIADSGDELPTEVASSIISTPAIGDILGDGLPEVVTATLDGDIYAWTNGGVLLEGFPISIPDTYVGHMTNNDAFIERGIFASVAMADLDKDGALDIVVATLDQQVIAYRGDGTMLPGFPVVGPPDPNDETKPYLRTIVDPTLDADGQTRRIISSPAIGDLDNDGNLEIVVGTNEAIDEQFSLVYAFTFDADANTTVAYGRRCGSPEAVGENCWPIIMVGGYPNALPYVGEGNPGSPILADLDGDGTLEIAAASIADFGRIYKNDGYDTVDPVDSEFVTLKAGGGFYGVDSNSGQSSSLVMINSGAFGDVDGNGVLDYVVGTAGANFVDNLLEDGVRADFDHQVAAWNTDTGEMVSGFPQIMEDLQFFLNPIIADVDGDGGAEVINTSATFVVHAFSADGTQPEGWPKYTGHWQIASPAVGDVDGDGLLELVVMSRAGYLFVYETEGPAGGNVEWPSFRHDARNSGNYHTPDPKIFDDEIVAVDGGCNCSTSEPAAGVWMLLIGLAFVARRRR